MSLRQQIELAREHLPADVLEVWMAKHVHGYGRHSGSLVLNISPEQFRSRLGRADRVMKRLLEQEAA